MVLPGEEQKIQAPQEEAAGTLTEEARKGMTAIGKRIEEARRDMTMTGKMRWIREDMAAADPGNIMYRTLTEAEDPRGRGRRAGEAPQAPPAGGSQTGRAAQPQAAEAAAKSRIWI